MSSSQSKILTSSSPSSPSSPSSLLHSLATELSRALASIEDDMSVLELGREHTKQIDPVMDVNVSAAKFDNVIKLFEQLNEEVLAIDGVGGEGGYKISATNRDQVFRMRSEKDDKSESRIDIERSGRRYRLIREPKRELRKRQSIVKRVDFPSKKSRVPKHLKTSTSNEQPQGQDAEPVVTESTIRTALIDWSKAWNQFTTDLADDSKGHLPVPDPNEVDKIEMRFKTAEKRLEDLG